jgi:hypothetical protein
VARGRDGGRRKKYASSAARASAFRTRNSCFRALLNAGACRALIASRYGLTRRMWVAATVVCEEAGEAADSQENCEQGLVAASASGCLCSDVTELGRE